MNEDDRLNSVNMHGSPLFMLDPQDFPNLSAPVKYDDKYLDESKKELERKIRLGSSYNIPQQFSLEGNRELSYPLDTNEMHCSQHSASLES